MRKNPEIKENVVLNNAMTHLNKINKTDKVLSGVYVTNQYLYKTDGIRLLRLPNPFGQKIETGVYDLNSLSKYDNINIRYPDVEKFITIAKSRVFAEFKFALTQVELKALKSHKSDLHVSIQTNSDGDIEIRSKEDELLTTLVTTDSDITFEKRTTRPKTLIDLFEAMLDVPTKKFRMYYGRTLEPMLFVHDEFNYLITPTRNFDD